MLTILSVALLIYASMHVYALGYPGPSDTPICRPRDHAHHASER